MDNKQNSEIQRIERNIGIVMRVGVAISAVFMIFGFVLLLITFKDNFAGLEYVSLSIIIDGIVNLNPYAYMLVGIFILIMTPVIRVISSIVLFAKEKDKLYVAITLLVLVILIISFIIGIFIR